jgi:RNA polymerase sigma-70 factor (ECF subfamily)
MASAEAILHEFPAVTRRVAIGLWRSRRRTEASGEIMDHRRIRLSDPARPIERPVTAPDVRLVLARLTPEYRAVIIEMYLNKHTVPETADILGVSVAEVMSRSYHAVHALRESAIGFLADTPVTA